MKKHILLTYITVTVLLLFLCNSNTKNQANNPTITNQYLELLPNSTLSFYSKYNGKVFVIDNGKYRSLKFNSTDDSGTQSKISLKDKSKLLFHYTKTTMLGFAYFDDPTKEVQNILMIGLGGGSMPRFIKKYYPHVTIDCVDIDPVIVEIAKRYFFVSEGNGIKIFVEDGRKFVEDTQKQYDIIFLDAFNAEDSIPYQLTSIEFLTLAKKHLSKNGIIVTNFINHNQKIYEAILATYKSVFNNLDRFNLRSLGSNNVIIIASDDDNKKLTKKNLLSRTNKLIKFYEKKYNLKKYAIKFNSDKLRYKKPAIIHDK